MKGAMVLLAVAGMSSSPDGRESISAAEWVKAQKSFPKLEAMLTAAEAALQFEPATKVERWSLRARRRAWLPQLDVRLGTDADVDVRGLGLDNERWTQTRGFGIDLSLRWTLADLVFTETELRIDRARIARAATVRLAHERVVRAYFDRLRVELKLRREAPTMALRLEAARLDGLLVAYTRGAWRLSEVETND